MLGPTANYAAIMVTRVWGRGLRRRFSPSGRRSVGAGTACRRGLLSAIHVVSRGRRSCRITADGRTLKVT